MPSPAKLRILHIIKSLGRGGAEMLLPETLALHSKEQFEFHYIYFLPWKNQMVEAIEQAGGKVTLLSANNNLKILTQRNAIAKYIKTHKIQVVHCHLPWAGFVGRFVFKKLGVPTVYTEHNKQERYHKVTKVLNKLTFNWHSQAIAVSDDVAASIQKHIRPKVPVHTLLNGVNTQKFTRTLEDQTIRKELGIPNEALVVGAVAVFRFQKRLVEWLEVMADLNKMRDDVFGVIVGDGPLKDEVLSAQKRLGLEDKVFFVGLQEEVRPYYNAMDIFMMTSEFEGLPIALLEAMSMSCGVFTTNAGGIKEVMTKNELGHCVDVKHWKELVTPLSTVTKREAQAMGEAARAHVQQHFSLQVMVNELEKVYKGMLKA